MRRDEVANTDIVVAVAARVLRTREVQERAGLTHRSLRCAGRAMRRMVSGPGVSTPRRRG